MTVQAKLRCTVNRVPTNVAHSLHLNADAEESRVLYFNASYDESEENKGWSKWTPSASLEMYVTNPAAFEQFEVGKDYILTFEPAD